MGEAAISVLPHSAVCRLGRYLRQGVPVGYSLMFNIILEQ
jgi:hypothetical protein